MTRQPPGAVPDAEQPSVRVLQLIDSLVPAGAEQSLVALAPHLRDRGVDLHVAYLIEREGLRGELEALGVSVSSIGGGDQSRRGWRDRARHLIRQVRPDVVHTTLFEADLAGRRAAAREKVPCVSSLVNTAYGRNEAGANPRLKVESARAADLVTGLRVTRFHAVTDHVAHVMSRRLLIPRSRIEVVHRGRDDAALGRRTLARRHHVRDQLGLAHDTPLVLAVGRQEPQKGFDVLVDALPRLLDAHPDARVLVAGRGGRASAALAEQVNRAGLGSALTFLGMRSDVPDLMAGADVLAFPSLWEGAAGTLIEAMALECPVVSSDLPTLGETVDNGTAWMVPPRDATALAVGLGSVLANPAEAATRAGAGRRRFEASFTVGASASGMAALYRRAART